MKKLLLTLLTVVCAVGAWADVVTFTFKTDNDITYTATGTSGGGSPCTVSKSNVTLSGTNAYTNTSASLSCYAKSTLTITAPGNITQIDLEYNGKVYPFDEAVGDGTKGTKYAASGAHAASYTPITPASSITLNNTNGGKTELLSLTVTYTAGALVNVTGVSLNKTSASMMVGEKLNLTATVAPANATNKLVSWTSSDETVATVSNGVVSAKKAGNTTITVKTADGNKTATCDVNVTAKTAPVGSVFFESFDAFDGVGANDDVWGAINTTPALGSFDNSGWTTEGNVLSGNQCASIRKSTADTGGTDIPSGLTTPAIGVAGNGHVTFNAQSWTGDTNAFSVDIVGGGTFTAASGVSLSNNNTTAKVTLTKNASWDNFDLSFTGLTANSKFRFYMAKGKRGFLDEVAVWVAPATTTINITTPEGYSTFVSESAFEMPEGFMGAVAEMNGNELRWNWMYDEGEIVPANTPILVFGTEDSAEATLTTGGDAPATNYLVANTTGSTTAASTLAPSAAKFYALSYDANNENLGFYWRAANGASFDVPAGKVFLALPSSASARGFVLNGKTTGIKAVESVKVSNVAYNLAGQRVAANAKGIVIVNGKKMLNK